MPKLPLTNRMTRKTTVIVLAVGVCVIIVAVAVVFLFGDSKSPLHAATYKEVADLGATQGNNEQYAALSGLAVSSRGYAVIANDNLSLYGTNGAQQWTVKGTQDLSFSKIDAADDGIVVLAITPPIGNVPSNGLFNNDILGNRIIKYDYNGKVVWQYQLPDNINVRSINYWGGDDVGVAGSFTGSMTLGQDTITSVGGQDIVLLDVVKKAGADPGAVLNKQIGTTGDDTIGQYERYTATEFVLNLGGSNALIHARVDGRVAETSLKNSAGTFVTNIASVQNADTTSYLYDWVRSVPNAVLATKGQNVGTVALVDANQTGTVQTSQDQSNNDSSSDQPPKPPEALVLQKIDGNGLQTDTKQVTEFNGVSGGNYNPFIASDNRLVLAVNNNGDTAVNIYGTNLDKQAEYTIKSLWPSQLYEYNNHVYLAGYLIPSATQITSSEMKIYQLY